MLEFVDISEDIVNSAPKQEPAAEGRKTYGSGRKRSRPSDVQAPSTKRAIRYKVDLHLLPSKYYRHEFKTRSDKVIRFIEEVFIGQLVESMLKRLKRLQAAEIIFDLSTKRLNKERAQKADNGKGDGADAEEDELEAYNAKQKAKEKQKEDESSSDEDEDGDGDNTTQRMKNRRNPELDYEEAEDDDLEVGDVDAKAAETEEADKEILADEEPVAEAGSEAEAKETSVVGIKEEEGGDGGGQEPAADGQVDLAQPVEETKLDIAKESKSKTIDANEVMRRVQKVKNIPYVIDYEFDAKRQRWCKVTILVGLTTTRLDMGALIETEAKKTFVHRVGNIQRALIVKDVNARSRGAICDKMIKTEGVSLLSLVKFNHVLDLNAIYSNDIHAIARTYGIEAANQAIRREMANVFAVYGIEVDSRHLSLIADYMTYNGSVRGMNRMSMEASASPFQQMSFESTIRYLKMAAILGLCDDIKSPSAALVFGRPTRGGTGRVELLHDNSAAATVDNSGW